MPPLSVFDILFSCLLPQLRNELIYFHLTQVCSFAFRNLIVVLCLELVSLLDSKDHGLHLEFIFFLDEPVYLLLFLFRDVFVLCDCFLHLLVLLFDLRDVLEKLNFLLEIMRLASCLVQGFFFFDERTKLSLLLVEFLLFFVLNLFFLVQPFLVIFLVLFEKFLGKLICFISLFEFKLAHE